jgi:hypothetical protein
MSNRQTILIENDLDIIEARMQVRTLARESGLDLFDQARISLATSTLAIILGLERSTGGTVMMERVDSHDRRGVQVVCLRPDTSLHDLAAGVLDDARRMVDDLRVEEPPSGGVAVILIKWVGRVKQHGQPLSSQALPTGSN